MCKVAGERAWTETLQRAVEHRIGMRRAIQFRSRLSLRGAITVFALLAFIIQSFATQTHIHVSALSEQGCGAQQVAAQSIAAKNSTSLNREQIPRVPSDDPAHCPFCQEFLLSGAYVAPVVLAVPLPVQITASAPLMEVRFVIAEAVSHRWNSRGPPRS